MFYEYYFAVKFLICCWQAGVVDAMTVAQLVGNLGIQWAGMSGSALYELRSIKQLPAVAIKPLQGLIISYSWIKQAPAGSALRYQRVATLASLLSSSGTLAGMSSVPTNAAHGALIYNHILHMQKCLRSRGGHLISDAARTLSQKIVNLESYNIVLANSNQEKITNKVVYRYFQQYDFTIKSKQIITNMFHEYKMRHSHSLLKNYSCETFKSLPSIYFVSQLPKTSLNLASIVLWSSYIRKDSYLKSYINYLKL